MVNAYLYMRNINENLIIFLLYPNLHLDFGPLDIYS